MAKAKKIARKRAAKAPTLYKAPALDKGLEILAFLAGCEKPVSTSEIAGAIGRSKTEIYRMLLVLEARGYIERSDGDGRYSLTDRLFELSMQHAPKRDLHESALPVMEELARTILQSCHLGLISRDDIVIVARVESPGPVNFAVKLGYRVPVIDSTSGRVIFAFQSQARQAAWLADFRAAHGRAKAAALAEDARAIAGQGYAFEASRLAEGIRDIGAPIVGASGDAVASLTVPFVSHRYVARDAAAAIPHVLAAAKKISGRLQVR